ncbi:AraC family transcriptional regulator [Sabulilitoribacter multivorans]|uniref:AraC family transcriptional regulator n=1 Tax=Flaviramulus multivorans TaxID=1304750 RepID=A0ABS9IEQ7_9FLAO|nr:AraC family transcriptional regulator [Flaviramulus multivorans]MCF7559264.1 AraC family transcriptional regulator [Flaviramulus multivorans]
MLAYNTYKVHQSNQKVFQHFKVNNQLFVFYNCPQKEKVMQLYNAYNQFLFSIGGKRIFSMGNQRWELTKDTAFLLKRTAYHQEMHEEVEGWKVLAFYVKDAYFKKILEEFRPLLPWDNLPPHTDDMLLYIDLNDQIKNCFLSMLPYFDDNRRYPQDIIEMKFKELLYNIFIHPDNKHILAYVNAISEGYQTPIWEVMETNYMFNLKLDAFAQITNRSLSAFKRDFRKHYNTSPGKWLIKKRLERAKIYLGTTNHSIQSIAFDSGFNNASHFSRVFQNQFNISPSTYRNSLG